MATPSTPKPARVSKTFSIRQDLADRLEAESTARVIGQGLIVEKAIETFLGNLPTLDLAAPAPAPSE